MSYTAAQIIADALAIAKCPGFLTMGGRALNYVLDDLSLHRNLKENLVTRTLIVPGASNGPFPLEADYLRTYDLWYLVDGTPYFLNPASLRELDQDNIQQNVTNYPYEWATDISGTVEQLYIYPQSNTQLSMTHRYYLRRPPIASPESSSVVPWFSDQDYLVQATAMRMMRVTDDSRYTTWVQDCEQLLKKHLMTEGDEQQVVKEVMLDPRRFRTSSRDRPTKLDPF